MFFQVSIINIISAQCLGITKKYHPHVIFFGAAFKISHQENNEYKNQNMLSSMISPWMVGFIAAGSFPLLQ